MYSAPTHKSMFFTFHGISSLILLVGMCRAITYGSFRKWAGATSHKIRGVAECLRLYVIAHGKEKY